MKKQQHLQNDKKIDGRGEEEMVFGRGEEMGYENKEVNKDEPPHDTGS